MKIYFLFFLLCSGISYGQKPALMLKSYKSWPAVGGGGLSGDGRFAYYNVQNLPIGKNTLHLKTTAGKDIFSCIGLKSPQFSENSAYLYGTLPGDSLLVFYLKNSKKTFFTEVKGYELQKVVDDQRLLVRVGTDLIICELTGRTLRKFPNISQYKFSSDGNAIILVRQLHIGKDIVSVWWFDTITGKERQIYEGPDISNVIFDSKGLQAAFFVNIGGANSIYHYKSGTEQANVLADKSSKGISPRMSIVTGDYWAFSKDGESLFVSLQEDAKAQNAVNPDLQIWSYQDNYLRSFYDNQDANDIKRRSYLSMVSISNQSVQQLLSGNQKLLRGTLKFNTDHIFLVESTNGLMTEPWNQNSAASYYLCFSNTGKMIPIELGLVGRILFYELSPTGKYFAYFHPTRKTYVCYNMQDNEKRDICKGLDANLGWAYREHYPDSTEAVGGVCGWLPNDTALLIQTAFDVWKADPMGIAKAVNITNGIGVKNKIVFYPLRSGSSSVVKDKILFSAFNIRNKDYGFYKLDINKEHGLKFLSMGARYIGTVKDLYTQIYPPDFIYSNGGFLLRWQKADESPNYFYSEDLRSFKQLSNIQPHKDFNWMSAELCNYKGKDGNEYQGLLYKPEDFDPNNRYPLIFSIYETESNSLNAFCKPELSGVNISPSVLASNGFLVFLPDIKGKVGGPGQAALESVIAAVKYLRNYKWVDTLKMGLMGHSFGGFETNYILTRCNIFAAAIPSAGVSDMVNDAMAQWESGENKQYFVQFAEPMMGKTFNDDPQAYIENSPILNAKRISTPILFMHNDGDHNVNYEQTRSLFIVLRSLQKPCWWLNYKGQGHGVGSEKKQLDYNTKVWQFLDHYLKGAPMPSWMKEHI